MEILVESLTANQGNIITESVNSTKDVFLSGVFMQAEVENRNKRRYQLAEMLENVKKANESITEYGGIFGELDHPESRLSIALDRVSHVITELYMSGNNAMGKIKLLDTPVGLIGKELARSGVRYGVSSRGAGNVNEGLVSNFNFITIDLVATPSAQSAYPKTVMESIEGFNGGKILTLAENVKEDDTAQKYFKKEILKFLNQHF